MVSLQIHTYDSQDAAGYGAAQRGLKRALYDHVDLWEHSKNVLNFMQPKHFIYGEKTIGYTPWESTELPTSWVQHIKRVNDMWTTAEWLQPLFESVRGSEVFVLPHGIDEQWTPLRHHREESRPFTFLHVGEPAVRKGGDIVMEAWWKFFRNNKDVKLIFKTQYNSSNARYKGHGPWECDNIEVVSGTYSHAEMWKLFALVDCMVYPSRGEGFGFIPLEAMGSGLPTIYNRMHMGDYAGLVGWSLERSKLVQSTDTFQHPGLWLEHDIEELQALMSYMIDAYDNSTRIAWDDALFIHKNYSWSAIGELAASRLAKVLS